MNTDITSEDIKQVLDVFQAKAYEAGYCENETPENSITRKCEELFKLDYNLIELENLKGALSTRYPCRIFIPEIEKNHRISNILNNSDNCDVSLSNLHVPTNSSNQRTLSSLSTQQATQQNVIYEDLCDATKIREIITMAKYARCRQRFIVPVILFRGKYICRSATISIMPETYGRRVVDYAYDCINGSSSSSSSNNNRNNPPTPNDDDNDGQSYESIINSTEPSPFSYEEVIKSDIQLLTTLNVTTIIDLMMEKRKVKYFMTVSSSEKADAENHYRDFNIISLPYPGCEFFKNFRDNNYMATKLLFNWKQTFIDATLSIPKNSIINDLDINWLDYQNWDLVLITQNYLKAILKYIQDENNGLLVHCISGWDRTPLFISLVRLSLWADGLIHQSLTATQITYFTLAYDWYLFGHQLPDRLRCGEDILFFSFNFLKHITDDEFTVVEHRRKRTKTTSSSGGSGSTGSVLNFKNDFFDDDSREDFILEENAEELDNSNDSFVNLDVTNPNENIPTNITKNRSPNAKRNKTSPISVPGVSRQRHDSTSSNGSWQLINEVGSIETHTMCYVKNDQQENGSSPKPIISERKKRLNAVRTVFIKSYGQFVGLKFKEGSSLNITSLLDAISEQLF